VAALVWSRWPTMTNDAVTRQITQTAVDVGVPGWDKFLGWGRLDAYAAVTAPQGRSLFFLPLIARH
jgi:hypothetical protein